MKPLPPTKPLASLTLNGTTYTFYVGLAALLLNVAVAAVATLVVRTILPEKAGATVPS